MFKKAHDARTFLTTTKLFPFQFTVIFFIPLFYVVYVYRNIKVDFIVFLCINIQILIYFMGKTKLCI